MLNRYPIIDP